MCLLHQPGVSILVYSTHLSYHLLLKNSNRSDDRKEEAKLMENKPAMNQNLDEIFSSSLHNHYTVA